MRIGFLMLVFWMVLFFFFQPNQKKEEGISVQSISKDYPQGKLVTFDIKNNTEVDVNLNLEITKSESGEWKTIINSPLEVSKNNKIQKSFEKENAELLTEINQYQVIIKDNQGNFLDSETFNVSKPGIFRSIWWGLFFKPLENLLFFFLSITNGMLWASIILITLVIKLILLIPGKKAIIAQKKMQEIQPELNKIKQKNKNNPQGQAKDMMELWKKHNISPFSSIMPMFIQFPFLIALFFIVKNGLMSHNHYFLYNYEVFNNFDFSSINYKFLWMDLSQIDPLFLFPVILGLTQFWQLKSMSSKNQNLEGQQKIISEYLPYILAIVIIAFSMTMPSSLSLYWFTSTIFTGVQQWLIQPSKQKIGQMRIENKPREKEVKKNGKVRIKA